MVAAEAQKVAACEWWTVQCSAMEAGVCRRPGKAGGRRSGGRQSHVSYGDGAVKPVGSP